MNSEINEMDEKDETEELEEEEEKLQFSSEITDIGDNKREIKITIPVEEITVRFKMMYDELRKEAYVPGFRPHRVPETVLRAKFGKLINREIQSALIRESMNRVIVENKIHPMSEPIMEDSELKQDAPYLYSFTLEVVPPIALGEYKGITVKPTKLVVSDADVDRQIDMYRNWQAVQQSITDRPVQTGDYVIVSCGAFLPNQTEPLMADTDLEIASIPSDTHFQGTPYEMSIIGMNLNETKDIIVPFPETYDNPLFAGKTVILRTTVKEIKAKVLPELTDAFANDFGEYDNVAAMKADIRKQLERNAKDREEEILEELVKMEVVRNATFEPPKKLVDTQVASMLGSSDKEIDPTLRAQLEQRASLIVKWQFVSDEIAELEHLEVDDDAIDAFFTASAQETGKDAKALRSEYEKADRIESIRARMLERKVLQFLVENAKIDEPEAPTTF